MGGYATKAIEAILPEKAAGGFEKLLTSGEGEANKTEAGKLFMDMLKTYSNGTRRDSELYLQGATQPLPKWSFTKTGRAQRQAIGASNEAQIKIANQIARGMNDRAAFGTNRVRLSQVLALAKQQGGEIHANNLWDIANTFLREEEPRKFRVPGIQQPVHWGYKAGITRVSPYRAPQGGEKAIKEFTGWTFLGHVAVPHAFQSLNDAMILGFKPWAKGFAEMLHDYTGAKAFAIQTGALWDDTWREMSEVAAGKETIWHKLFNMPGFSKVRQFNIIQAANAGRFAARYATDELLGGGNVRAAELQLKMLGLNPNAIRTAGSISLDDELIAGYRSADEAMFIERGLKNPWLWDETAGFRLASLYKTFAFREGKLIKDAIYRSFKAGPLEAAKTIAFIATVFPIAGKLIAIAENLIAGKSPTDTGSIAKTGLKYKVYGHNVADEYVDALSHMAAFGVWYSLFRAAAHNTVSDYLAGPSISLGKDITSFIRSKHKVETAAKTLGHRIPVFGPAIAHHIKDIERLGHKGIKEIEGFFEGE